MLFQCKDLSTLEEIPVYFSEDAISKLAAYTGRRRARLRLMYESIIQTH